MPMPELCYSEPEIYMPSEPVTQAQFYDRFKQSDAEQAENHRRMRELVEDVCRELGGKLEDHKRDDLRLTERVQRLEDFGVFEEKQIMRRSTWIALLISMSGVILNWFRH